MARLTDRAVKTAGVGRHGDGDGLHLIVAETGRRKWVLRFQMNGARRDMGLSEGRQTDSDFPRYRGNRDRGGEMARTPSFRSRKPGSRPPMLASRSRKMSIPSTR